ncbi:hypothetical protein VitviT2T_004233 [Vitis vinifera]|uniref:Gnk2-homologous domain-containing protein n=1 Tax=Vitis vinifera TaxID=29760 RepID=A0ABY9BQ72_VITVI|nr:hypothetical protein VitviT2T_004233 [Vitis vinifera]
MMLQAWQLWNEGKGLELMDPLLTESCCPDEFLRCYHIGLLCAQEDAFDRPTMSSVVVMLKSETVTLRQPEGPAFSIGRFTDCDEKMSVVVCQWFDNFKYRALLMELVNKGDVAAKDCENCVENASQEIMKVCKSEEAITCWRNQIVEESYYIWTCTVSRDQPGGFCSNCLMSAFGDLSGCCKTHEGGTILSRSCNMRFEVYRFYKVPTVHDEEKSQHTLLHELAIPTTVAMIQEGSLLGPQELPFMDLATVKAATDNFLYSNKLGQGGFGTVFKVTPLLVELHGPRCLFLMCENSNRAFQGVLPNGI